MEVVRGSIYDYPKYYDVLFGSDWQAEFTFLKACFAVHAGRSVRRLFEPACGTGRLLVKFGQAGYEISGNDLNPQAVDYCNRRLEKRGFPPAAVVADMADFRLKRKQDAAFNTINSFRHLTTQRAAEAHLDCMARAVAKGGVYVLGLHLTPEGRPSCDSESWEAKRGRLCIRSNMWSVELDRKRRRERVKLTFDVSMPTRQFRLEDELIFRTYTLPQFRKLLGRVDGWELAETYDFGYRIEEPVGLDGRTEDALFVLRRR